MAGKISLHELQCLATNPEVPESELWRYFTAERNLSTAFGPAVGPNPETVEIPPGAERLESGLKLGNALSRMRRANRFDLRLAAGDKRPVLISGC